MQRRKFVVGLGSLAAGGAATMGTGAISQFSGDRNFTGNIVSDARGYIVINGSGNATNGFVVNFDSDGEFELDFSDNGSSAKSGDAGSGLNPDAENYFDDAFRVLNSGPEDLKFYFTTSINRLGFYKGKGSNRGPVGNIEDAGNAAPLDSGDASDVGVYVDTTGLGAGDDSTLFGGDDEFTLVADTNP